MWRFVLLQDKRKIIHTYKQPSSPHDALFFIHNAVLLLTLDDDLGHAVALRVTRRQRLLNALALVLLVALALCVAEAREFLADLGEEAACGAVGDGDGSADDMCDLRKPLVGEEADQDGHGQRQCCEDDADGPLVSADLGDAEGLATDEDNGDLGADHDAVDADEEVVVLQAGEDVQFVVETTVVEFVEDLHPDEGVEDHRVEFELLCGCVIAKDFIAAEI